MFKNILNELYQIDSSLRRHEKELIKLIQELLDKKPEVVLDKSFRKELREELLKRTEKPSLFLPFLKPVGFVALGALIFAAVILPFIGKDFESPFRFEAQKVEREGFGNLALKQEEVLGKGGGMTEASAPRLEMVDYSYSYTGEDFKVPEQMEVLKKKQAEVSFELGSFLSQKEIAGFDISKLKDPCLENFSLKDKDGYSVNVDFSSGLVSIFKLPVFQGGNVSEREALQTAESFLKEYEVDLSNYSEPEIRENIVLYPLEIQGKSVYEMSGTKTGLHINVSSEGVIGLWNLSFLSYESSVYMTASKERILSFVQKRKFNIPSPTRVIELELQDPEYGYVRFFREADEFLVPALIFPAYENGKYVESRVVPLIKEVLDKIESDSGMMRE